MSGQDPVAEMNRIMFENENLKQENTKLKERLRYETEAKLKAQGAESAYSEIVDKLIDKI